MGRSFQPPTSKTLHLGPGAIPARPKQPPASPLPKLATGVSKNPQIHARGMSPSIASAKSIARLRRPVVRSAKPYA
jgi:hypothetical protein